MMIPLVSLLFRGPSLTEENDLAAGAAVLGRPVWDARALLDNLELRVGLPRPRFEEAVRVQRWSLRLAEVGMTRERFYSKSYAVDPLGTTRTLLEWRDELVLAGWNGEHVENGGERLETLNELEALGRMAEVAPGLPDRLRGVERELASTDVCLFEALELAESVALWPELWRRVFSIISANGTPVRVVRAELPVFPREGDLGRAQALLRGEPFDGPPALVGDGSLILLEAETSWELAQASAALLRAWQSPSVLVVRGGDTAALDAAFAAQGLPSQGVTSRSVWRPALQVLALALELAFEPRDPYRVLELVTLPQGPFNGRLGRELAKALAEAPGIGGRPWQAAKERLREAEVDEGQLQRVSEWLEGPAYDATSGAPRAALHEVARRVREWLASELTRAHTALGAAPLDPRLARAVQGLGAAFGQVAAFAEALGHDARELLGLTELRQLLEEASGPAHALEVAVENAGRMDHVAHPAGVRMPRDVVLWWYCEAGTQWRPALSAWRQEELAALGAVGVRFVETTLRLGVEARAWHQPILAARKRLVLAVPRSAVGQALAPHPILDEIIGRLGGTSSAVACITVRVRDWLDPDTASPCRALEPQGGCVSDLGPLALPAARLEWLVDPDRLAGPASHSASSIEAMVRCPLKWVLRYCAGLYPGSLHSIASGPILNGKLGHRLIEELHLGGVLMDPNTVGARASAQFDRLVSEESAVLLRAGERSELTQLKAQLCGAIEALSSILASAALDVIGVEVDVRASWRGKALGGRVDLLLEDAQGHEVVLDLKWGSSRYAELLRRGGALQLATYARLRQLSSGASEPLRAGYFSLSNGKLLTTDRLGIGGGDAIEGPSCSETWQQLDATLGLVQRQLAAGRIVVTGVKRSLPLVEASEPPANDGHYLDLENGSGCSYCHYSALCGRSWEECA